MMPEGNDLPVERSGMDGEARPLQAQVEDLMNRCVTPALAQAAGHAEAALHDASEELRQHVRGLTQSVQHQPLTAIALAALVGFVFARLTDR